MTKTSWDIHQCPLAKRCRARWEKLEPVQGDTAIRFCAACDRSGWCRAPCFEARSIRRFPLSRDRSEGPACAPRSWSLTETRRNEVAQQIACHRVLR